MIHRVVFGSIERFIGILIEHFAGAFPTWLAPVQVKVLPISDKYMDYAEKVEAELDEAGIRAEVDTRAEKIGYKIREAQTEQDSVHAGCRPEGRGRGRGICQQPFQRRRGTGILRQLHREYQKGNCFQRSTCR